jgi:N-acetyl-anhydromuramyl-L-alanine amidase AmpD
MVDMSNSSLICWTKLSPNNSYRSNKITKITLHHAASTGTIYSIGNYFALSSSECSTNYGVDSDGKIALYVPEDRRAWTSSNADNDSRAITIEIANCENGGNWRVSDKALEATIELCTDICRRNGITKLNYTGDARGNLTCHNMFVSTVCPGPYLQSKLPWLAAQVNSRLGSNKSVQEIVNEVIQGKWGNGADRKARLTAAGYHYAEVQALVDTQLSKKKPIIEIAREVIQGKWGNGNVRKQRLTAAGYDYNAVQKKVNELL